MPLKETMAGRSQPEAWEHFSLSVGGAGWGLDLGASLLWPLLLLPATGLWGVGQWGRSGGWDWGCLEGMGERMDLVSSRPRLKEQLRIQVSAWMALEQGRKSGWAGGCAGYTSSVSRGDCGERGLRQRQQQPGLRSITESAETGVIENVDLPQFQLDGSGLNPQPPPAHAVLLMCTRL